MDPKQKTKGKGKQQKDKSKEKAKQRGKGKGQQQGQKLRQAQKPRQAQKLQQAQKSRPDYLTRLPPELLVIIMKVLATGSLEDILNLCQVNTKLVHFCRDDTFWKHLYNLIYGDAAFWRDLYNLAYEPAKGLQTWKDRYQQAYLAEQLIEHFEPGALVDDPGPYGNRYFLSQEQIHTLRQGLKDTQIFERFLRGEKNLKSQVGSLLRSMGVPYSRTARVNDLLYLIAALLVKGLDETEIREIVDVDEEWAALIEGDPEDEEEILFYTLADVVLRNYGPELFEEEGDRGRAEPLLQIIQEGWTPELVTHLLDALHEDVRYDLLMVPEHIYDMFKVVGL